MTFNPAIFIFIALLFFPVALRFTGSMSASQAILNLIITSIGLFFITISSRCTPITKKHNFLIGYLLFATSTILLLNIFFEGSESRISSDAVRLIFAALYILIGAYLSTSIKNSDEWITNFYLKYCVFGFAFSLAVFTPFLYPIVDLYKGRMSNDSVIFHFFRLSGFSGFPTDFGCSLVLGFLLAIAALTRNWISIKIFAFLSIIVIAGLIGSASRAALIQFGGVIFILALTSKYHFIQMIKISAVVLLVAIIFILQQPESLDGTFNTISYISVDLDDPDASVAHRFHELSYGFQVLSGQAPVPIGIERDHPFGLDVVEGFWSHYIIRYSYFGALTALCLAALIGLMLYQSRKNSAIGWSLYYWYISFIIFVAPFSDVTTRFRGLPLYFTLIGIAFAANAKASKKIVISKHTDTRLAQDTT